MTEAEGCDLLTRVFSKRGYNIAQNVLVNLEGIVFTADGWDETQKVGFEYLTHEANDHDDLPPTARKALEALIETGVLFFFLIDENDVEEDADLEQAAERFLDAVESRRMGPRRA